MEGRRALIEDVIFYVIFGVMDFCFNVHAQNQVEDMAQLFCTNQAGIYEGIYDKLAELDHPVTMGTTTVYVAGKKEFMGTCSNADLTSQTACELEGDTWTPKLPNELNAEVVSQKFDFDQCVSTMNYTDTSWLASLQMSLMVTVALAFYEIIDLGFVAYGCEASVLQKYILSSIPFVDCSRLWKSKGCDDEPSSNSSSRVEEQNDLEGGRGEAGQRQQRAAPAHRGRPRQGRPSALSNLPDAELERSRSEDASIVHLTEAHRHQLAAEGKQHIVY